MHHLLLAITTIKNIIYSFLGGARFSDEDKPIYFSLPPDVQGLIGSKAIMELCRSSVSYSVDLAKDKAQIFKRVPVTDLNEHVLMTAIDQHSNARSLFARSLGHSILEARKRLELPLPKPQQAVKDEAAPPPDATETS